MYSISSHHMHEHLSNPFDLQPVPVPSPSGSPLGKTGNVLRQRLRQPRVRVEGDDSIFEIEEANRSLLESAERERQRQIRALLTYTEESAQFIEEPLERVEVLVAMLEARQTLHRSVDDIEKELKGIVIQMEEQEFDKVFGVVRIITSVSRLSAGMIDFIHRRITKTESDSNRITMGACMALYEARQGSLDAVDRVADLLTEAGDELDQEEDVEVQLLLMQTIALSKKETNTRIDFGVTSVNRGYIQKNIARISDILIRCDRGEQLLSVIQVCFDEGKYLEAWLLSLLRVACDRRVSDTIRRQALQKISNQEVLTRIVEDPERLSKTSVIEVRCALAEAEGLLNTPRGYDVAVLEAYFQATLALPYGKIPEGTYIAYGKALHTWKKDPEPAWKAMKDRYKRFGDRQLNMSGVEPFAMLARSQMDLGYASRASETLQEVVDCSNTELDDDEMMELCFEASPVMADLHPNQLEALLQKGSQAARRLLEENPKNPRVRTYFFVESIKAAMKAAISLHNQSARQV